MNIQGAQNSKKNILLKQKKKAGRHTPSNIKSYYKARVIKTLQ